MFAVNNSGQTILHGSTVSDNVLQLQEKTTTTSIGGRQFTSAYYYDQFELNQGDTTRFHANHLHAGPGNKTAGDRGIAFLSYGTGDTEDEVLTEDSTQERGRSTEVTRDELQERATTAFTGLALLPSIKASNPDLWKRLLTAYHTLAVHKSEWLEIRGHVRRFIVWRGEKAAIGTRKKHDDDRENENRHTARARELIPDIDKLVQALNKYFGQQEPPSTFEFMLSAPNTDAQENHRDTRESNINYIVAMDVTEGALSTKVAASNAPGDC